MKGVLICGGTGSRLRPLTEVTNKSLLPVYDEPLIYYPLMTLLNAGISEVVVISGSENFAQLSGFLGSGAKYGCEFTYRVQETPAGIAHALGLAKEFADQEDICAILGDNIYLDDISKTIDVFKSGGHVFLKEVHDPERFGVGEMKDGKIVSIEEKPASPKSNLALTGCYVFDNRCFDVISNLNPSGRGELEITDVVKWYMEQDELAATILADEWIDAGTFESLYRATTIIRDRKHGKISSAKEAALKEKEKVKLRS